MRTRVTAVLVARAGGDWLDQTIAGLAAQTRAPDRIVAVNNAGSEALAKQLADGGAGRVVTLSRQLSFGQAVQQAIDALPAEPDRGTGPQGAASQDTGAIVDEWFWLLSEDSAPEATALEQILLTVQRAPSVVLAGPKLVDWDRPERIIELGQSLTRYGSRWLLRRQELDQQQYDHLQDVLGVGPVGMLVRADVWRQLGGFDPGLPVFDDGLDFSVRARLAGYRVVVAPASRVRFAQSGVAGPRVDRRRSVQRRAHRQGRAAHLHRRIAYAPALFACFMWLGLPVLGVLRMAWALIREQPGHMLGELGAALGVFFSPGRILAARRRIRRQNTAGWAAIRPLRIDPKTVRTSRMIDREAILVAQGRAPRELGFISSGGLTVLIVSAVASTVLCWWALTHTSLFGGALAPLSRFGELWANTRSVAGVPADPFAWVLAVLGSITFWNPSHAVVLLLLAAMPLAALGGWIWAAQLTESKAGRALLGLAWAFSPVLLGSIGGGRLPTLILAVVLPWLLLAATRCRESWSWAGTASLLTAVALACAPVLIPAALVFLVIGLISSARGIVRVLSIAIAPLALFAPLIFFVLRGGTPLDLLRDPGVTPAYEPGTRWHLLLGFPEFGLEGWGGIFSAIGLGGAPATLLVGVLLLPIVLLAALGLITGRVRFTVLHAVLGGLGLLTTLLAAQLRLLADGSESVALWTGSGLTLYWIAMLGLAAVGCEVLRKAAAPIVSVALVAALVAVAPLAVRLVGDRTGIVDGGSQLPALVQAAGAADPELRTLVLTPLDGQGVRAQVATSGGLRLDAIRTAERSNAVNDEDRWVAELVGRLASTGDEELRGLLQEHRVGFVLLQRGDAAADRAQLQAAFDQHATLASAGETNHGLLWRAALGADQAPGPVADDAVRVFGGSFSSRAVWVVQVILLLGMVLLALPTGEVVERPARRRRPSRRDRSAARPAPADPAPADPAPLEAAPAPAPAVEDPAPDDPAPDRGEARSSEGGER